MKAKWLILGLLVLFCGGVMPKDQVYAQEMQEYTAHLSEAELQELIQESMGNIVNARLTAKAIDWKVPANMTYTTSYMPVSAGNYITMSFKLSKSGRAGIIDVFGNMRYVTGTSIKHGFKINLESSYCVFVKNTNSTKITAVGSYACNE